MKTLITTAIAILITASSFANGGGKKKSTLKRVVKTVKVIKASNPGVVIMPMITFKAK